MADLLANPVTSYILSFGGLGLMLALGLNGAHKFFALSERVWGAILLASGAVGGVMIQGVGLVNLPDAGATKARLLAAFIGVCTAMAAAGFSQVDLRAMLKSWLKDEKEDK